MPFQRENIAFQSIEIDTIKPTADAESSNYAFQKTETQGRPENGSH